MTLEEFYNIKVESKWLNIYFYSDKRIKDRFERNQMIMRLDSIFTRGRGYCGNATDFVNSIRDYIKMPKEGESEEKFLKWFNYWGADYFNHGYNLFGIDLISSCWIGGPWSWFNPKNGKIRGAIEKSDVETLGKYKDELEWFVTEFPNLDFYIYFTPYRDTTRIITLHLYDGKIETDNIVTKIPFNHEKYYGSYSVKKPLSIRLKFWLCNKFYNKTISKKFDNWIADIYNIGFSIWLCHEENYFTYNQLEYLLAWWTDYCIEYNMEITETEEENKK